MIIYNVTINVEKEIAAEWLKWMKEVHIIDIMATGYFNEYRMMRLLNETENDGETYAIQYLTDSLDRLEQYMVEAAPKLREKHFSKFQNKCLSFRTFLESI